ncbi:phosphotransferase [Lentzea sp. NPDC102401]|uniref:phosphotransferase n=1 Tax=Lentzea sp. NPDC102401 TaxID=3364128 RepID=UPI0037F9E74E
MRIPDDALHAVGPDAVWSADHEGLSGDEAGLVDDFDDDNLGVTPEELLHRLVATAPSAEDLVVAHGDFCPPNVVLRPDGSTVLIDVARLGVSDRHRDIALAHRAKRP